MTLDNEVLASALFQGLYYQPLFASLRTKEGER